MPWTFAIAIPGVKIPRRIEAREMAALPPDDSDYRVVASSEPGLSDYLSRFTTAFGVQLRPTIIVTDGDAGRPPGDDLSGFRNLLALSAIIEARRKHHQSRWSQGTVFSEVFDFSPVFPWTDGVSVGIRSPVTEGVHRLVDFAGQPAPILPYPQNLSCSFDDVLLDGLLKIWASRFSRRQGSRRRILRSIELACNAMRAPYSNLESVQDWGLVTSLWVSAFETLARPPVGDVRFEHVADMIKRVHWCCRSLRRRSVRAIKKHGMTTRPVQVYGRLYRVRNAFLHGDRIPADRIEQRRHSTWGDLAIQVPMLFRAIVLLSLSDAGLFNFPQKVSYDDIFSSGRRQDRAITAARRGSEHMDYERPLGATEGDFEWPA